MKKTLILLSALLALPSLSYAGLNPSKLAVGSALGYSIPLSDFRTNYKGSVALGVNGEYEVLDILAAGMEIGYNFSYGMKDSAKTESNLTDGTSKIWQFTPYLKAQQTFELYGKKAKAYGLFGAGIYSFKTENTNASATTTDSQSKFGWNAGLGLMVEVAPKWSAGMDVRYHNINTDYYHTQYFAPMVRMNYHFE